MVNNNKKISVIICTYNRAEILKECLDSLLNSSFDQKAFEIIVIDNNSTDLTKKVVKEHIIPDDVLRYCLEKKQGLSFARNRGWKEAKGLWVCYLDDDSYIGENFFQKIIETIERNEFDIFGGVYLPWYKYGKPKWYLDDYASNYKKNHNLGALAFNEFVDGGIMIVRRSVFKDIGGFSKEFGMNGENIGYGEEIDFQIRAREGGKNVGFNPEIIIFHLVPKYKLRINWFVKSNYYNGKQSRFFLKTKKQYFKKNREIFDSKNVLENDSRNIFWQNYLVKVLSLLAYNIGRTISLFGRKN